MDISLTEPLSRAWNRMVRVCFQPFDVGKWFVLGFCAWLAALGKGGSSCNGPSGGGNNRGGGGGGPGGGPLDAMETAVHWIQGHAILIVLAVLVLFVLIMAIVWLVLWLRSRGDFMFIDGIVKNRGAVVEPWHAFRPLANSVLNVRLVLAFATTAVAFVCLLIGLFVIFPGFVNNASAVGSGGHFILWMFLLIVLLVGFFICMVIGASLINWVIDHLILPVMYARDATVGEAWRTVREELLPDQWGNVVLYFLMRIVISMGVAVVVVMVTLLTCCIAALPYIGAVILLPVSVFLRSYSLYFVEQFGFEIFRFGDEELVEFP